MPRQPARSGLIEFAEQAGIQILATGEDTDGRHIGPITGTLGIEEALRRVVASTGLELRSFDGSTAVLRRRRNAAQPASGVVRPAIRRRNVPRPPSPPPPAKAPDIIVVGTRLGTGDAHAAAGSAEEIERRSLQTLSVLTSDDLERLPDTSLASVLRRVPGMQVSTSAGGGTVRVHGLGQVEERVNGRNLTSTVGRGYDVAALPSDLVSGIDVYKTPSASLIEGGIGGQVDFHTRRPFDFTGVAAAASLQSGYSDINRSVQPFASGYVTGRSSTGLGELGLLVGGAFQREAVGQRLVSSFNTVLAQGAQASVAPGTLNKTYFNGIKQLATAYGSMQWRPLGGVTLTGDFIYNSSSLDFVHQTLSADLRTAMAALPDPPKAETIDRATDAGTLDDVAIRSTTRRDDAVFQTWQAGLGAKVDAGRLTLFTEASYTNTGYRSVSPSATLAADAPSVSFDVRSRRPDYRVAGLDLTNSAGWSYASLGEYHGRYSSTEWAYRADAFRTFSGTIKTLKGGIRFDRRTVATDYGLRTTPAAPGMARPGSPYVSLTDGSFGGEQPRWVAPSTALLRRDPEAVRTLFGAPPAPPGFAGVNAFRGAEEVWNGYSEATFGFAAGGVAVDGNAGVRFARTTIDAAGTQTRQDGTFLPIAARQSYANWLPQINVRARLRADTLLRLAWSRQLTRPDFLTFSPGYSLNFETRTGGAGNPAVRPLRATQYDASLEWYFAEGGNVYIAGFYKDVDGFIAYETGPERIEGEVFQIARPYNLSRGWIGGSEVGYQQRFASLPGPLAGLGLNVSYTFVDSSRPANSSGVRALLGGVARHSYQLTGSYKRGGTYASVAWLWNSRIVIAASGDVPGQPRYLAPYGQLDASLAVKIGPGLQMVAGALNLLQRRNREYLGNQRYFGLSVIEDRRFLLGVRLKAD